MAQVDFNQCRKNIKLFFKRKKNPKLLTLNIELKLLAEPGKNFPTMWHICGKAIWKKKRKEKTFDGSKIGG